MILYLCNDCESFCWDEAALRAKHTGHRVLAIEGDDWDALERVAARHFATLRRAEFFRRTGESV